MCATVGTTAHPRLLTEFDGTVRQSA